MGSWLPTSWTKADQRMLEVLLIAVLVLTGLLTAPLLLRGASHEPTLEADLAVPVELPGVGTVDLVVV